MPWQWQDSAWEGTWQTGTPSWNQAPSAPFARFLFSDLTSKTLHIFTLCVMMDWNCLGPHYFLPRRLAPQAQLRAAASKGICAHPAQAFSALHSVHSYLPKTCASSCFFPCWNPSTSHLPSRSGKIPGSLQSGLGPPAQVPPLLRSTLVLHVQPNSVACPSPDVPAFPHPLFNT